MQDSDHTPQVSIGMPVYNGEKFIGKALDSLLRQTFTDFELIISDNASTDGTEGICRHYVAKDSRIRYCRQSQNKGGSWNFNFVLHEAQCDYFMWAACDDSWDKNFIKDCVNFMDNHTDIGIVFSKFWVTSRMYPIIKMKRFPNMSFLCNEDPFIRVAKYIELEEATYKSNVIYGLWRRSIAKQTIDAFDGMKVDNETPYIVFFLTRHKCFQIPRILFYKTYKMFPPGHWLGTFLYKSVSQWRYGHLRRDNCIKRLERHFEVLQMAIKRAGVWDNNYENMLNENYARAMKWL